MIFLVILCFLIMEFKFNTALPLCCNDAVLCKCSSVHIESWSASKLRLLLVERCEEDEEDTILIHDMRVVFGDFELIETGEDDMEIYIYRG